MWFSKMKPHKKAYNKEKLSLRLFVKIKAQKIAMNTF